MAWTRHGKLMERIEEEIRLTREEIKLSREEVRLSRESRGDLRDFIQEQTRRMERRRSTRAGSWQRSAPPWIERSNTSTT